MANKGKTAKKGKAQSSVVNAPIEERNIFLKVCDLCGLLRPCTYQDGKWGCDLHKPKIGT